MEVQGGAGALPLEDSTLLAWYCASEREVNHNGILRIPFHRLKSPVTERDSRLPSGEVGR